jgi:CheY-like chemotaxis protein/predicted regulator of Ras-like GTPase activity (Roadblock/LC7/MglB family)
MAYRLLVVPGNSENLRALPGQLGSDVDVQILESANDALWEVRNAPPEVIVANVDLPGMNGLDMAEILPNFGVPTKVMLWSQQPDAESARQATMAGVHHFFNGAVSTADLHAVLFEALRAAQREASAAVVEAEPEPAPAAPSPPPTRSRARDEPPARIIVERPSERPTPPRRDRSAPSERSAPTPEKPVAPPEPAPRAPSRRREGALVLTAESLRSVRLRLDGLDRDVGSRCILLADRAGMVLAETGHTQGLPTMVLLPLLSTSFSTAGQITQMLREQESSALYVHEGSHFDLYCFDIMQRFMLVIVFDKSATSAKIGSVWVYAKRAIRDIQDLLS